MSIKVKSHRRGKSIVKAHNRVSIGRGRDLPVSVSSLRGERLRVLRRKVVNFASGPKAFVEVSYKERSGIERLPFRLARFGKKANKQTADLSVDFLKRHQRRRFRVR